MVIDANRLRVGEDFSFNGSAESDGAFFLYGGGGTDTFLGGSNNDTFYFGENGQFGATDRVDGGVSGTDQLGLRGNYTIVFGASQLTSIESIGMVSAQDTRFGALGSRYDYNLTMNDGNRRRRSADDGRCRSAPAERDLHLRRRRRDRTARSGSSADRAPTRSPEARAATSSPAGSAPTALRGGGGADIFVYRSAAESAVGGEDRILDFTGGSDLIDLSAIDADSGAGGDQAFHFIGSDAFSGSAGELRASFDAGSGLWAISGDADGDGGADFLILVTTTGPDPIAGGDFSL